MNKNILLFAIIITGIFVLGKAGPVIAQTNSPTTPKISYPITELGNCANKTACKAYCDKESNVDACLSFAKKNNLMTDDEIKTAKNFKNTNMVGPGGCKGKDECKLYCNGPDHMDECIAFAEKNGMMSGKKLEEAKKVKGAIAKGIKPPACGGKEACDAYCSSSEHVEECVNFGEAAGIISKEDSEKIRKGPDGKKGQGKGSGEKNPEGKQGRKGPGGQGDGNGGGGQGPGGQNQDGPGQGGPGGPNGGGGKGGPGGGNDGDQGNGGSGGGGQGQGGGNGGEGNRGGGGQGGGNGGGGQ